MSQWRSVMKKILCVSCWLSSMQLRGQYGAENLKWLHLYICNVHISFTITGDFSLEWSCLRKKHNCHKKATLLLMFPHSQVKCQECLDHEELVGLVRRVWKLRLVPNCFHPISILPLQKLFPAPALFPHIFSLLPPVTSEILLDLTPGTDLLNKQAGLLPQILANQICSIESRSQQKWFFPPPTGISAGFCTSLWDLPSLIDLYW